MIRTVPTTRRVALGTGCSAVIVAAALLTGCSSSSGGAGSTASSPAAGSSSTASSSAPAGASSSVTSGGATAPAASSSASTTSSGGGGSVSLGSGSFCTIAKKVQANEESAAAAATGTPASLKALVTQATQELSEFVAIAPSAIKGDVQTIATAENGFLSALAAANYDVSKLSPSALTNFDTPAVEAASNKITAYLSSQCGITEPSDDSSS